MMQALIARIHEELPEHGVQAIENYDMELFRMIIMPRLDITAKNIAFAIKPHNAAWIHTIHEHDENDVTSDFMLIYITSWIFDDHMSEPVTEEFLEEISE